MVKLISFLCLIFLAILIPFILLTRKYRNPYKLIMVFGKKGSGKSTFITKTALNYVKRGRVVYSTIHVPGTRFFDVQDIGRFNFPPESVVFIDEVGMIWDNRNYKAFRNDVRDWFKLQRHNRVIVYLFSQTFDIDIKLRNLTDQMYLLRSYGGVLSIARRIARNIIIVNPSGDSEARIADSLEFTPFILNLFGGQSVIFTWIPAWVRYFDSFELEAKDPIPFSLDPFEHFIDRKSRRIFRKLPCFDPDPDELLEDEFEDLPFPE